MAADTSSSLTSTSHTLTAAPAMAPNSENAHGHILALLESMQPANRHAFLRPSQTIPTESLNIVKETLEGFATQVSEEQQQRLKESRKRKRAGAVDASDVLKLRKIYVDGFETSQVWQQAKRVIGGVLKFSEAALDELEESNAILLNGDAEDSQLNVLSGEEELEGSDAEEEDADSQDDEEDIDEDEDGEEDEELLDDEALEGELEDGLEAELDNEDDAEEGGSDEEDAEEYVADPHGLNDGFFSIDDFNKQTQWFEEQDARGNPDTDLPSDEEEIDWNKDYMKSSADDEKKPKRKSGNDDDLLDGDDDLDAEDDDDDAGPTFGNMALDAPEGDSEDDMDLDDAVEDEDDSGTNANEIFFKDFFAPPPRKSTTGKPKKKKAHFEPKKPTEEDMERAMADVRRDLFEDESDNDDSDDALSDVEAGDPKARRSAHERRQAKIAEEIRQLEAASVAKRQWTLSGEAAAVDRPVNSLLEQDLDFEHVGKPVPVITPEITEGIEELIKRRILAQEFDEVIRRRPGADSLPTNTRRGIVELDDSKPNKSLAEIYEEEHVKNTDPDAYVSKSDEKLQKEEKEVEGMWKDVCARLDALSSWHYKPKPVAPALSVVTDAATVSMEDAQPATAQGVVGESSRLAPQEIYKAGSDNVAKGEVVLKSGIPVARTEMSREDKSRRRRRNKERVRKAGGVDAEKAAKGGSRAKMQRDTMADLKKGGVKVINRKGEITDVDGKKPKAIKAATSGSFKL